MTTTFTVRGHKVRSASMRRFIVVKVTTDKWAVMDEITTASGYTYHEVAREERTGFRRIFTTEAEAVEACGAGQTVKVWSKAGATVEKRSDAAATARAHASRIGGCVVIDTTTGEEI